MATQFHRPELDTLRFGAFFLVFLHHALPHGSAEYPFGGPTAQAFAALARAGALGVDLFFALSAYLLTGLLLREHAATGTLDIRAFYARRILRIWPLYYFALFVLAPAMAYLRPGGRAARAVRGWIRAAQRQLGVRLRRVPGEFVHITVVCFD